MSVLTHIVCVRRPTEGYVDMWLTVADDVQQAARSAIGRDLPARLGDVVEVRELGAVVHDAAVVLPSVGHSERPRV